MDLGFFRRMFQRQEPDPFMQPDHWQVYHGCKSKTDARAISQEGFKPRRDGNFGPGVYMTSMMEEAKSYCDDHGIIFRLYIEKDVRYIAWDQIPAPGNYQKIGWCMDNGYGLILIEQHNLTQSPMFDRWWFVAPGIINTVAQIPGWYGFDILNSNGEYVKL